MSSEKDFYEVAPKWNHHARAPSPLRRAWTSLGKEGLLGRGDATTSSRFAASHCLRLLGLITALTLGYTCMDAYLLTEAALAATETCSPVAYDSGTWTKKTKPIGSLMSIQDVHAAVGFSGCKAEFQSGWNFGLETLEPPYDSVALKYQWEWQPGDSCRIWDVSSRDKLQLLVDRPLLLLGDSRTRQYFFELSCELAEHVVWQGAKPKGDFGGDAGPWRLEPQHLFLDASSALVSHLSLPGCFDFDKPIITYLMAYIPLSRGEMRNLTAPGVYAEHINDQVPLSSYQPYETPMNRYVDLFTGPESHYRTMFFSTGAHYGPVIFVGGFRPENALAQLRASLKVFYAELSRGMSEDQRVLVRAAEQGHTGCAQYTEPWLEVQNAGQDHNSGYMPDLNEVLMSETETTQDARFKWLGTTRLSRLRPDAHMPNRDAPMDCIHFAIGSGVFEAISRYMWHTLKNL